MDKESLDHLYTLAAILVVASLISMIVTIPPMIMYKILFH